MAQDRIPLSSQTSYAANALLSTAPAVPIYPGLGLGARLPRMARHNYYRGRADRDPRSNSQALDPGDSNVPPDLRTLLLARIPAQSLSSAIPSTPEYGTCRHLGRGQPRPKTLRESQGMPTLLNWPHIPFYLFNNINV